MSHGDVTFLPRHQWRAEAVDGDRGPFGIYGRDSKDEYIALGLDEEQKDFAITLLEHDGIGDTSTMDPYDIRVEVEHQTERVSCLRCARQVMRGMMDASGRCRECQS